MRWPKLRGENKSRLVHCLWYQRPQQVNQSTQDATQRNKYSIKSLELFSEI